VENSSTSKELIYWFVRIWFAIAVINCLATLVTMAVSGFDACLGTIGLFYGVIQLVLLFITVFLPAAISNIPTQEIRDTNKPWFNYLVIAFKVQAALIVVNFAFGSGRGHC
jgi:hypothetical protein